MPLRTKKEVNRFMGKVYQFLDDGHKINLVKMKVYSGYIFTNRYPTIVTLDPQSQIIPVLLHEIIHYEYPCATEDEVLSMEKTVVHHLSNCQLKRILHKLVKLL